MISSDSTSVFATLSQLTVVQAMTVGDAAGVEIANQDAEKNTACAIAASLEIAIPQ